ncbi:hypothetical protein EMIHUDRAFT_247338 [Emiliania huxleyi CCMP1516]|uniref:ATP-dependent DNA helicase n=2 Tax=Emiliania huxleyi TaxID=2903 RepID=A0A0D3IN79_EMIH1|nr:hypothetical protein EMIHUDRAFT_247338 [Emiliania huxleyi CCMP1516]EOD12714.1 hypothetical protein EMIHUDRAFT_247338 [Emiliania huxleyi CCMP1516]|eukprot:XP_005765143.1 hypothetical protein EMIHUDRAFT_247338 [Emiliania huxleyi CCMP1516]
MLALIAIMTVGIELRDANATPTTIAVSDVNMTDASANAILEYDTVESAVLSNNSREWPPALVRRLLFEHWNHIKKPSSRMVVPGKCQRVVEHKLARLKKAQPQCYLVKCVRDERASGCYSRGYEEHPRARESLLVLSKSDATLFDGDTVAELVTELVDMKRRSGAPDAETDLKIVLDFNRSGQGGVGKSTLIALLVQEWRSQALNVLVTGSSGKAAALLGGVTDQPYMSHRWVEFTLSELTEIVRTDPDQIELAEMLSHARLGHEHLTQRDRQLLQSRVCACHGGHVPFTDVMRIRPPGGKAKDEREVSRQVTHCVPCGEATILAARRHKVQALNDAHVAERIDAAGVVEALSIDRYDGGGYVPPSEQKKLSDRLSGFAARLQLYIGQHLVITANRQRHHEQHLNGNIVRVDNIQLDASGQPIALKTTLVDTGAELVIPRFESNRVRLGEDMASRTQFPARNRRSSSGATLANEAYVALSRIKRIGDLHLWHLHLDAIKSNPGIDYQYTLLHQRRLRDCIQSMPDRERVSATLPLARVAAGMVESD